MLFSLLLRNRTRPVLLLLGTMAALALCGPAPAQPPSDQGERTGTSAAEEVKPAPSAPIEPKRDRWTPFWKGLAGLGVVFGAGSLAGLFWGGRTLRKDIDSVRNRLKLAEQELANKAAGSDVRSLQRECSEWTTKMPEAIDTHLQKPDHRQDSWVYRVNSWAQETHRRATESSALLAHLRSEIQAVRQQLDQQQQVLQRLPEGLRTDLPAALPQEAGPERRADEDPSDVEAACGEAEAAAAEAKRLAVENLLERYREAALQGDRNRIRAMAEAELNITQASEEILARGTGSQPTQLEIVPGGGSYLLVAEGDGAWLFPTIQTLSLLAKNQPQKGIFDYERQQLSAAVLKQPAEVRPVGDAWEVITPGIVIVPA